VHSLTGVRRSVQDKEVGCYQLVIEMEGEFVSESCKYISECTDVGESLVPMLLPIFDTQ
jgi:hypothetical protein